MESGSALAENKGLRCLGYMRDSSHYGRGKMEKLGNPRSSFRMSGNVGVGMDSESEGTGFREVNCPDPCP